MKALTDRIYEENLEPGTTFRQTNVTHRDPAKETPFRHVERLRIVITHQLQLDTCCF